LVSMLSIFNTSALPHRKFIINFATEHKASLIVE